MKYLTTAVLFFLFASVLFAGNYEKLIDEGISLHDAGKYSEAIKKYREAVSLDAQTPTAYFEMAYSFSELKQYDSAIAYGNIMLKFEGIDQGLKSASYMLIGNCYDMDNKYEKAVESYKKGIAADPDFQMLHFNLAVAYFTHNQPKEACVEIRKSLELKRIHPGSNYYYAFWLMSEEKRVPYLFASLTAIALENYTERARREFSNVSKIFKSFAIREPDKKITISVSNDSVYSVAETMIGMYAAKEMIDTNSSTSSFAQFKNQIDALISSLSLLSQKTDDFMSRTYIEPFMKVKKLEQTEVFARWIHMASGNTESADWCKNNTEKVKNCIMIFAGLR